MSEKDKKQRLFGGIGQQALYDRLSRIIRGGRIGSAYLFSGPRGSGKSHLALEFFAALNCLQPREDHLACGECDACRKAKSFNHSNLLILHALPGGGSSQKNDRDPVEEMNESQYEALQTAWKEFQEDPYRGIQIPSAHVIRIASVRSLKKKLRLGSDEEGWRIVLILRAEQMNAESFNSLLKTLEEPPPKTAFILSTESAESLPETIRSRCQLLRFNPVAEGDLIDYLEDRGFKRELIPLAARLCSGNINQLHAYMRGELTLENEGFLELWRSIMRGEMTHLTDWITDLAALYRNERHSFEDALRLMIYWFRDAQSIEAGVQPSQIILQPYANEIGSFARYYPGLDYYRLIKETQQVIELAGRNIYIPLLAGRFIALLQKQLLTARRR